MASQRWTIDRFLPAYLEAAEKGMTREDFAESIGLKSETVYQRVYNLRRSNKDIPMLRSASKIPMMEQADKIMESYRAKKCVIAATTKPHPLGINQQQSPEESTEEESQDIAALLGLN